MGVARMRELAAAAAAFRWVPAMAAVVLLSVGLAGCGQRERSNVSAASGIPAPLVPVGQIPGPHIPGTTQQRDAPNPLANDDTALAQGRQLFVAMNCSGCHGGHAGGGMGPSLRDKSWIYGGQAREIFDSIAQGRAHGMPSWGLRIPQDQIWRLVAYIQSLGSDREPDPPSPAPPHAPDDAAAPIG
jgi:cytochrome c oxidase cbb3-type subunit 3